MRSGLTMVMLLTLGGGVMFTLFSVIAWVRGRRVSGVVLAIVAGLDFAFFIGLLQRAAAG